MIPVCRFENSITCRSLLTDRTNHYELKKNHRNNQYYSQYQGFWNNKNDGISDVGNFENIAFTDNMRLEVALAGAWISAVIWTVILLLMVKERHHLRYEILPSHCSIRENRSKYGRQCHIDSRYRQIMPDIGR